MWTQFMDMHSGGGQKLDWAYIYIQAPEKEAEIIFQNMFGRNPHRVTCTCCGEDYSIWESETLRSASAYERGCQWDDEEARYLEEPSEDSSWRKYRPLSDYRNDPSVRIVGAHEIEPEWRVGELRDEGYVWRD